MKAFAVFTMHKPEEATWFEAGCAFIPRNHKEPMRNLMKGEQVGTRIAVLRKTYGGALGNLARSDAQALGGICIEFDNGAGYPDSGECYAAFRDS